MLARGEQHHSSAVARVIMATREGTHQQQRRAHILVQEGVDLAGAQVVQPAMSAARVIDDENVERSECFYRGVDDSLGGFRVSEVRLEKRHGELASYRLCSSRVSAPPLRDVVRRPAVDENCASGVQQTTRDGIANPSSTADAGDKSVATGEAQENDPTPRRGLETREPGSRGRAPTSGLGTEPGSVFEPGSRVSAAVSSARSAGAAGDGVTAAIEDVGPAEILERVAPNVDGPAERPHCVQEPGNGSVQLIGEGSVGHQRGLRVVEERAEPGPDAGAGVVARSEDVVTEGDAVAQRVSECPSPSAPEPDSAEPNQIREFLGGRYRSKLADRV